MSANLKTHMPRSRPLLSAWPLLALVGAASGSLHCEQPKVTCNTAHGSFAVRYTLVEGSGECAQLKAGTVGVQPYVRVGPGGQPSYDYAVLAIRAEEVGTLLSRYTDRKPGMPAVPPTADPTKLYSLAEFSARVPGGDSYCGVKQPSAAELVLPATTVTDAKGMVTNLPAVQLRYEWSNIRFYMTAGSPGTQFGGELAYTLNGCTARYEVQGMYPAVACGNEQDMPDEAACSPCADPTAIPPRPTGSGISPDVSVSCHSESLLCLPTGPIPSRRDRSIACPRTPLGPPHDAGPEAGEMDAAPEVAPDRPPSEGGAGDGPADTGNGDAGGDRPADVNGGDRSGDLNGERAG